eukprot:GHVS01069069.1.p1 GENE.GHVS01069069.1~~GHVS01069069.1.p1  ORF type:complete len:668 (-),score=183.02 GHVS01069069.1:123-2096(-)
MVPSRHSHLPAQPPSQPSTTTACCPNNNSSPPIITTCQQQQLPPLLLLSGCDNRTTTEGSEGCRTVKATEGEDQTNRFTLTDKEEQNLWDETVVVVPHHYYDSSSGSSSSGQMACSTTTTTLVPPLPPDASAAETIILQTHYGGQQNNNTGDGGTVVGRDNTKTKNFFQEFTNRENCCGLERHHPRDHRSVCLTVFICIFLTEIAVNFDSGAIPAVLVTLKEDYGMTDVEQGILGALPYIGLVVACPVVGRLLQKFSPKRLLLFTMTSNLLSTILLAASINTWMLFVSRLLIGLTQAAFVIYAPVWVDEFAPPDRMTIWMGLAQGGTILGVMLGYLMAGYFRPIDWHFALIIQCSMLFILIIIFLITPQRFLDMFPEDALCMSVSSNTSFKLFDQTEEEEEGHVCGDIFLCTDDDGGMSNDVVDFAVHTASVQPTTTTTAAGAAHGDGKSPSLTTRGVFHNNSSLPHAYTTPNALSSSRNGLLLLGGASPTTTTTNDSNNNKCVCKSGEQQHHNNTGITCTTDTCATSAGSPVNPLYSSTTTTANNNNCPQSSTTTYSRHLVAPPTTTSTTTSISTTTTSTTTTTISTTSSTISTTSTNSVGGATGPASSWCGGDTSCLWRRVVCGRQAVCTERWTVLLWGTGRKRRGKGRRTSRHQ